MTLGLLAVDNEWVRMRYFLIVFPALVALTHGPGLTALAGVVEIALFSLGADAAGVLTVPQSKWSDLPTVATIMVACVFLAWVRERSSQRLTEMNTVAHTLQQAVLPDLPGRVGPLHVAGAYRTSSNNPANLGGDLFQVVDTPFGTRLIMADVSGHNLETIATTVALLGTFNEAAQHEKSLFGVGDRLNDRMNALNRGRDPWQTAYATAVLAEVDAEGRMELFNYGHPAPILVRTRAAEVRIPITAPLGMQDLTLIPPESISLQLNPDDVLGFYTDGVLESCRLSGSPDSIVDRFEAGVARVGTNPHDILEFERRHLDLSHATVPDDMAALIVRFDGIQPRRSD